MDKRKLLKIKSTSSAQKKNNTQDDLNINNKKTVSKSNSNLNDIGNTNSSVNNKNSINYRSKSNLTAKDKNINNGLKNFNSHITLERNGSMPNLNLVGHRMQIDKTTKLRYEYDKYLSSLEAKYTLQMIEKKINLNINEQKRVFREEFDILKKQLVTLSNELELINELKIEKKNIDKKFEVLEILNKTIKFNELDEEIMSLFTSTAYKVVLKNFKELNETDLNAVKILLNEIVDQLKQLDYENKTKARIQLKELLIKVITLTKELDKYKLKCEELFNEQKGLQDHNSSLKILKSQFKEAPDSTSLSNKSKLLKDFEKVLDEIEW